MLLASDTRAMGGDRHELARVPRLHIAAACVLVTEQLVQLSACRHPDAHLQSLAV
ncbi:MAG: hypothetical protein ABR540_03210 [Acidimicrobiales bacterium]